MSRNLGRRAPRMMVATTLSLLAGIASAAEPAQVATQLLDHLQAGRVQDTAAMLTPAMAAAAPADRLQVLWNSLGELQQRGSRR